MTAARTSLVEQKRLQWAKEREEIARLMGNRNSYPPDHRAYGNGTRGSFASESIGNGQLLPLQCCANDPHLRHLHLKSSLDDPRRYHSRYASTTSLRSLANSDFSFASLRDLDRCGATIGNNDANRHPAMTMMSGSCCSARSLLDLGHNDDDDRHRHRLSYLPPIYKDELRCQCTYMKQPQQQKQEYEQSQERRMQQSRSSQQQQHRCSRNNARHRSSAASNATSTPVTSDQKKKTSSSQTQATTTRTSGEEDREGETSGYASDNNNYDSLRLQQQQQQQQNQDHVLPRHVNQSSSMSEKTWRNPYCNVDENARPTSRNLPTYRSSGGGEFNRQRWGSVWGQDVSKDPPPPSWLERGLSRLDHNSQVLVITHDSASSPSSDGGQSSTGSSYGSSSSEAGGARSTYLRGQNQPIDAAVLQERETKRQKALELQRAIKRQLEDRERSRMEERENELREQRAEEERLRRQQSLEKQRIEEEKRVQREREAAKLKKSKAMQEVLEAAERQAKEDKQLSRRRKQQQQQQQEEDGPSNDNNNKTSGKSSSSSQSVTDNNKEDRVNVEDKSAADKQTSSGANESSSSSVKTAAVSLDSTRDNGVTKKTEESQQPQPQQQQQVVDLPVSQEVTIVLSGRIDDPELLLRNAPLKLVNLVLNAGNNNNSSPRGSSPRSAIGSTAGLGALLQGLSQAGQVILHAPPLSPRGGGASNCTTPRLLTPSKYRMGHHRRRGGGGGRECGTQTDCEADPSSTDYGIKEEEDEDEEREDRKDARNNTARRELEKSTSTTGNEDSTAAASKSFPSRAKAQKRTSLESRPRWNANRPGTRYRTQSEKDPHYQRRMRLMTRHHRSRRTETSDEGCSSDFYRRSPSPVVASSRRPLRKQQQQQQPQQQHSSGVGNNNTIVKAKLSRNSVLARRSGDNKRRSDDVRRNVADYNNDNENDNVDDDYSMDSLTSLVPLQTDKNGRINIQRLDDVDSSSYNNNTNDRNVWCGGSGGGGGGSDLLSHLTSLRNGLMAKKKEWDLQECPVTPLTELY
ncbi:probable inactive serine/threonine-protein kinase bub1 [Trichogramma pretiosum]|uniref:probable inactive serine/threonine-protein kinase bub1 n=1 Tax=Trichogramma pretiosum TaxID=7493 RepID=UPI0006C9983C|nr:probable inactive serine/threonine-protein kinase bub1 [Trichogramma pretiosum]